MFLFYFVCASLLNS